MSYKEYYDDDNLKNRSSFCDEIHTEDLGLVFVRLALGDFFPKYGPFGEVKFPQQKFVRVSVYV